MARRLRLLDKSMMPPRRVGGTSKKERFWKGCPERSRVKARIVANYFTPWAEVMLSQGADRIGYVDLFAGRGRYRDGAPSTPVLVLEHAVKKPRVARRLLAALNDADPDTYEHLRGNILSLSGIEALTHPPNISNFEVDGQLAQILGTVKLIPTLSFIDPWGYKEVSLSLVHSMLKDWGCDCIFFFNYNRVNMGIHNQAVRDDLDSLLGQGESRNLEQRLRGLSPGQREFAMMGQIDEALRTVGGQYTLRFRFTSSNCDRPSHFLIFVTKHHLGYDIMKQVMAKESSFTVQGVSSFEFNPHRQGEHPPLPGIRGPLDDLEHALSAEFAGERDLTAPDIYQRHNGGTHYLLADYKRVLRRLEEGGQVRTEPSAGQRRKNTFGDHVKVSFPG